MNRESTENIWPFAQTQGCKRHSVFKIIETLVKKMCMTFIDLPCTSLLKIVPPTQTHAATIAKFIYSLELVTYLFCYLLGRFF